MPEITLIFFARYKDLAGVKSTQFTIAGGQTVASLKETLAAAYPALAPVLPHALVAINHEFAGDETPIPAGAEVAVFPPVSGGSGYPTIIRVSDEPVDTERIIQEISLETSGAACAFFGLVRGKDPRQPSHATSALEYEAYAPMAEEKLRQVAAEMRARWPLVQGIAIIQLVGCFSQKSITVLIACSSAHREDGIFEAARYGIDRLKEIVPVWKKEIGPAGEEWLEGHYHPKPGE